MVLAATLPRAAAGLHDARTRIAAPLRRHLAVDAVAEEQASQRPIERIVTVVGFRELQERTRLQGTHASVTCFFRSAAQAQRGPADDVGLRALRRSSSSSAGIHADR